jgi:hypothetical protein
MTSTENHMLRDGIIPMPTQSKTCLSKSTAQEHFDFPLNQIESLIASVFIVSRYRYGTDSKNWIC